MPLLGMGGETEKGIALPILPWWNAVAINDVPAQSDFYSSANVVCLTIWYAMPANRKKWPVTESLASAFKLSPGT
ncbi:chaperone [Escherichia coli]|uniref:Chaperone n=1 Tax=Escherichia coli TaxID=562 RepID=A0A484X109_ECOLX|nr:chaperone [Escherichia coli]